MSASLIAAAFVATVTAIGVYRSATAYRDILALALIVDVTMAVILLALFSSLGAFR